MICPNLLKITFYVHHFLYSFTDFDGSDGITTSGMVSPRSIMVLHGFRSKDVKLARRQNTITPNTPNCWLPTKVMYPANANKGFSWLTRSTPIFVVEERSNTYMTAAIAIVLVVTVIGMLIVQAGKGIRVNFILPWCILLRNNP